jgi:energy-converting hydrogenase Eha subunit B
MHILYLDLFVHNYRLGTGLWLKKPEKAGGIKTADLVTAGTDKVPHMNYVTYFSGNVVCSDPINEPHYVSSISTNIKFSFISILNNRNCP